MRTLRLFALLDHLRGRTEPVSAEMLAQELQVSVRTIYRDMVTLQAMGAPLRGEAGIGYQLEKGYFLPPLHFDPDELDALMLGTRLIASRDDEALAAAARRVSAKISAAIGCDKGEAYTRLPLRAVARQSSESDKASGHLTVLRTALRDKAVLNITYCDLENKRSQRSVRPLGLTNLPRLLFLRSRENNKAGYYQQSAKPSEWRQIFTNDYNGQQSGNHRLCECYCCCGTDGNTRQRIAK